MNATNLKHADYKFRYVMTLFFLAAFGMACLFKNDFIAGVLAGSMPSLWSLSEMWNERCDPPPTPPEDCPRDEACEEEK